MRNRLAVAAAAGLILASAVAGLSQPLPSLKILVPANPGGGWDQTSRAIEQVLRAEKLVSGSIRLTNRGGAGGTIGLAEYAKARGEGGSLMTMGLVMVGAILTNKSPVTLDAVTPIARLTSEYEVIAVPASSRMQTLKDFTDALRKDPGAVAIAGGSRGGTDHILAALIAEAVGVPGAKVNYVAYAGGGEAVASLLGAQVAAGISGYGEFQAHIESGKLRALAVSSPARLAGINVPTLREQGINVEFGNWRGVVAPEGISAADRKALLDTVERMVRSAAWRDVLKKQNWEDAYLAGDAYAAFIKAENARIATVLQGVGLLK
ncbi:MAG: C4-dicarboxylate ABC transporter substrate-binding protein [Candidatus Rokubacteria bacterium RIFCSPLOWO2_12_FULL_71_19]|nr:MAG: C4-dicarboxylate ABC transporter substrate-binding protein [Candidatus Rokubacteria bacterium RIFCSPLOWO2_12_FULL_71_19]